MQRAIAYGLAGGGIVVAVMALVYSQSRSLFLSPMFQYSLLVIYLLAMVFAMLRRPPYGSKEATKIGVVVYLFVNACYYLYTYLLYEVIDPQLYQLQIELMLENLAKHQISVPGEFENSVQSMLTVDKIRYTLPKMLLAYAQGSLFGIAIAFILGFLLGRNAPAATAA